MYKFPIDMLEVGDGFEVCVSDYDPKDFIKWLNNHHLFSGPNRCLLFRKVSDGVKSCGFVYRNSHLDIWDRMISEYRFNQSCRYIQFTYKDFINGNNSIGDPEFFINKKAK